MARMKVTYTDGNVVEINAGPRAEVALERQYEISAADANRLEHVYYLAWSALSFAGQVSAEFDVWLATIDDAEIVVPEKPAGPTKRARKAPASSA